MFNPAALITDQVLTFDDILSGALGPREAEAAAKWQVAGAKVEPIPSGEGWTYKDPQPEGFDTRVWPEVDEDGSEEEEEEQEEPVAATTRQHTRKPPKKSTAPATAPRAKRTPASTANEYGRAAFVGHSDGVGMMARRRARTSRGTAAPEEEKAAPSGKNAASNGLPAGWKSYVLKIERIRARTQPALPPGIAAEVDSLSYDLSPEGVVCDTKQMVRAVAAAEGARLGADDEMQQAAAWVQDLGRSARREFPRSVAEAELARRVVALQRRKVVLRSIERALIKEEATRKRPAEDGVAARAQRQARRDGSLVS